MALTQKQKLFAEQYLANGFNARKAYYEAFGANKANKQPSYPYTLLKKPEIAEYIAQRRDEIYESINIDSKRITQELSEIAFAEKGDPIYNTSAKLKALELLAKSIGLEANKMNYTIDISFNDNEEDL